MEVHRNECASDSDVTCISEGNAHDLPYFTGYNFATHFASPPDVTTDNVTSLFFKKHISMIKIHVAQNFSFVVSGYFCCAMKFL